MASNRSVEGIASASARHPWRVIAAWTLLLALLGTYALTNLEEVLSNQFALTADVESVQGSEALADSSLSERTGATETIMVRSLDGTTVDDDAFETVTNDVVKAVRTLHGAWEGQGPMGPPNPLDLVDGSIEGAAVINYFELRSFNHPLVNAMVNDDRTVLLIPVTFGDYEDGIPIRDYFDVVEEFDSARFDVTTIGALSINDQFQVVVGEDLVKAESIGIPIAILVLVIVFGALVAPALPLVLGVYAVGLALGIAALIGQSQDLQLFIQNMITMLGLAVGIDYALFIVERYREQRDRGFSTQRSIEIAAGTSGKAVVFSGLTVVLAMIGVMFVEVNIFFSLGLGAIIVVLMAVALTMTLLPAMLSLLGDRINWPRKNYRSSDVVSVDNMYHGVWGNLTRVVVARPWVSLITSVTVLLLLSAPVLQMETGFTGSAQLPPGEITDSYKVLEEDFSAGLLSPMSFVFEGDRSDEADSEIAQVHEALAGMDEFVTLSEPVWDDNNRIALIEGTLGFSGSTPRAYDLVHSLRDTTLPDALGDDPSVNAMITGTTAIESDMLDILSVDTPIVFAFVLGMSFILLMLAFRSLVVPLKAMVYNLLSVGSAWGILVLVFSKGFLRDVLGYTASPVVESWLPILLFCILFGLSMDYHVFILSRIREHYDISHNNAESVAIGLRSTGHIITGAALIMVVVFGAFSKGSMLALQQLGFGLAVAVFVDATIIRSVLVPSLMTLMGNVNWWLPKWLEWLPDIRIEGHAPEPPQMGAPQEVETREEAKAL